MDVRILASLDGDATRPPNLLGCVGRSSKSVITYGPPAVHRRRLEFQLSLSLISYAFHTGSWRMFSRFAFYCANIVLVAACCYIPLSYLFTVPIALHKERKEDDISKRGILEERKMCSRTVSHLLHIPNLQYQYSVRSSPRLCHRLYLVAALVARNELPLAGRREGELGLLFPPLLLRGGLDFHGAQILSPHLTLCMLFRALVCRLGAEALSCLNIYCFCHTIYYSPSFTSLSITMT